MFKAAVLKGLLYVELILCLLSCQALGKCWEIETGSSLSLLLEELECFCIHWPEMGIELAGLLFIQLRSLPAC